MDFISEALIVSDRSQSGSCVVFDLKSGCLLMSFKEGNSAKRSLSVIGHDYIIMGLNNQSCLKVFPLSKMMSKSQGKAEYDNRMCTPGFVTALAVSDCGMYCVAGIERNFFVWEVSTGSLLTSLLYHSQTITCVRFSCDGSHLITGGKDGMVLVWLFSELIASSDSSDSVKPRYTWMDHAAEVTDIFVGSLGIYARVVTVSKDMTSKVYELDTGNLLATIHVDFVITAATMDESEYFLILGSSEGDIHRINLFGVKGAEVQFNESDKKCTFKGHSKEITCLAVSAAAKYLVSGSEDCSYRVWDMSNFSCIRKGPTTGPVTNVLIILTPPGLKTDFEYYPRLKLHSFKRNYEPEDKVEYVSGILQNKKLSLALIGSPDEYFDSRVLNCSEESLEAIHKNDISVDKLCLINAQLYAYALGDTISEMVQEESDSQPDSD